MATRRKSTQFTRKAALAQACTLADPETFRNPRDILAAAAQFDEWLVHGRVPPALTQPQQVKATSVSTTLPRPKL